MKLKTSFLYISSFIVFSSFNFITDWYTFDNDYLTLYFPEKPTTNSQLVESSVGKLNLKTAFFEPSDPNTNVYAYGLITSEYPDSIINSNKKEILSTFFRNSIDGSVKSSNGRLLTESEISLNGYPGRQVKIDYGNGQAFINMRLYLVQNKSIILQVIEPTNSTDSTNKLKFFNSIKLK